MIEIKNRGWSTAAIPLFFVHFLSLDSVLLFRKNTQTQLKDVEKLLKLDPSNTELVRQKQQLLAQAIKDTKEKLATLKTAAEQANEQLQKGEITQQQYDALQREIQETEQQLKALESQASTTNATLAKIEEVGGKFQQVGEKISSVKPCICRSQKINCQI